mmetsp:Transcript_2788/g.5927  ORF Transcript_2788/g.5927 Transcript_2788/m.5927 type:complete len:225 (+) Transcript_2788:26-700(+)
MQCLNRRSIENCVGRNVQKSCWVYHPPSSNVSPWHPPPGHRLHIPPIDPFPHLPFPLPHQYPRPCDPHPTTSHSPPTPPPPHSHSPANNPTYHYSQSPKRYSPTSMPCSYWHFETEAALVPRRNRHGSFPVLRGEWGGHFRGFEIVRRGKCCFWRRCFGRRWWVGLGWRGWFDVGLGWRVGVRLLLVFFGGWGAVVVGSWFVEMVEQFVLMSLVLAVAGMVSRV